MKIKQWVSVVALISTMSFVIGCTPLASKPTGEDSTVSQSTNTSGTESNTSVAISTDTTLYDETQTTSSGTSGATSSQAGTSSVPGSGTATMGSQANGSSSTTNRVTATTTVTGKPTTVKPTTKPPAPAGKEMCGVWISYIELNELFKNKTVSQAKAVIDTMMKNCASYGVNTVFFHVRSHSNAYYKSSVFKPAWSVSNLIKQGFDPLKYAIESAHKREIKLHAWVNPYRIGTDKSYQIANTDSFSYSGSWYYVPTSIRSQRVILDGIREIFNNYAVDGVQFDDYFYPNGSVSSTSVASFEKADYDAYKKSGGKLSVADWRRSNVDALVSHVYSITHEKSNRVFGISPEYDIDKNRDKKYADLKKWLSKPGYVDYMCPQIYFGFKNQAAPFAQTVDEWLSYPRHASVDITVGLALHKTGLSSDQYAGTSGKTEWKDNSDIMKRQVQYLRSKSACKGMVFFSYGYFDASYKRDNPSVAAKEIQNLLSVL